MSQFTVSQALRRVKKLKGRMGELQSRAASVVSYVEGAKPEFDFDTLRGDVAQVRAELVGLKAAVDVANATAKVQVDGESMTVAAAILRLQETKAELAWLPTLHLRAGVERCAGEVDYDDAGRPVRRVREVTYVSALSESKRVAELDKLRDLFERLNDAVERSNHVTPVDWKEPAAPRSTA